MQSVHKRNSSFTITQHSKWNVTVPSSESRHAHDWDLKRTHLNRRRASQLANFFMLVLHFCSRYLSFFPCARADANDHYDISIIVWDRWHWWTSPTVLSSPPQWKHPQSCSTSGLQSHPTRIPRSLRYPCDMELVRSCDWNVSISTEASLFVHTLPITLYKKGGTFGRESEPASSVFVSRVRNLPPFLQPCTQECWTSVEDNLLKSTTAQCGIIV